MRFPLLLVALSWIGCDGPAPADGGHSDAGSAVGPGDGVLLRLEGDPESSAADALPDFGPVPNADVLDPDRRVADRLVVVLDPTVNVAALNDALDRHRLGIALARPPSLVVGLATAPLELAEAEALLETLRVEGVALSGWLPYAPEPDLNPQAPGAIDLAATSVLENAPNLTEPRFPAAWNASALAQRRITVLVADRYFAAEGETPRAHPLIPSQRFAPGARGTTRISTQGTADGNHGYWVAGVLGAAFDGAIPTGTSPDPARLLDVLSVDVSHLQYSDILAVIAANVPADGPAVLNASIGFGDAGAARFTPLETACLALAWRRALVDRADAFLVVTSAGNNGDRDAPPNATHNSPFNLQANIADLRTLVPDEGIDRTALLAEWDRVTERDPRLSSVVGTTIMVGSSDATGARARSSTPGDDLRMIGELVDGACSANDGRCDTEIGVIRLSGTSAAAPAAAGLAAYLWSIDPSLTPAEVRRRMLDARDRDRWVDAYEAVLSLELGGGPEIRAAIADVDADGRFTEDDVVAVMNAIAIGDGVPPESRRRDWSRFDLNGDGFTRSDTTIGLDADGDGVVVSTVVLLPEGQAVSIDEDAIGDVELLCVIAYGSDFDGSTDARDAILAGVCGTLGESVTSCDSGGRVCMNVTPTSTFCGATDVACLDLHNCSCLRSGCNNEGCFETDDPDTVECVCGTN
jgi:subtilisin family serine protease